ncbi:MAG: TIGR04211 family SH3 domain-containing protein [Pseudomonadales bacterium]
MRSLLCGTLLLFLVGSAAGADFVYITDELWVKLRATPTDDARILHAGLRSGTEFELLEHDLSAGYSRVRMTDGREGWIATQYLVTQPIASDLLGEAQRKLGDLERDNASLASEADTLSRENVELRQHNEELAAQAELAERSLETAMSIPSRVVRLDRQSKAVEEMNALLRREVDDLVRENQALADAAEPRWMLTGMGLLVLGIALGAFVMRRKRNW